METTYFESEPLGVLARTGVGDFQVSFTISLCRQLSVSLPSSSHLARIYFGFHFLPLHFFAG